MRKKPVDFDGGTIMIGALSLKQMTEWGESAKAKDGKVTQHTIIIWSLNNALRQHGVPPEQTDYWNSDRLKEEFDAILVPEIFDKIVDYCGLEPAKEKQGEAEAASKSSSATLDAASSQSQEG